MSATEGLIAELSRGMGELVESGREEPAELIGAVLLSIDERPAREQFIGGVEGLGMIETRALSEAMLRTSASRRKPHDWHRWLDPLSPEVVESLDAASTLLEGLGRKLWEEATKDEEPIEGSAFDSTLQSLARLTKSVEVDGGELAELISASVATPPIDDGVAQGQASRLALAERFADIGVVRIAQFAAAALVAISEALEHQFEPQALDVPISRHAERWATRLASAADDASRDRLRAAAENSPWLPSPFRESLILGGSLRDGEEQAPSPYSDEEIVGLVETHRGWFDEGLAIWIEGFYPAAAAVGPAIAPLCDDELPAPVVTALSGRFDSVSPAKRTELALPALENLLKRAPSKEFLEEIKVEKADHTAIVDLLATLYGKAGNNPQRESILEVAEALGPLPDPLRKQLITEIVIPMAHQGKEALDIVIKYLNPCLPPPRGTLQNLRKTLRERAKGKQQKSRVDKALLDANLIKRSGFLGRGRKDVMEG
jgi:hypothetical protein